MLCKQRQLAKCIDDQWWIPCNDTHFTIHLKSLHNALFELPYTNGTES